MSNRSQDNNASLLKEPRLQAYFLSLDPALRQRIVTEAKDVKSQTFVVESMMNPAFQQLLLRLKPDHQAKINQLPLEKKYLLLKKHLSTQLQAQAQAQQTQAQPTQAQPTQAQASVPADTGEQNEDPEADPDADADAEDDASSSDNDNQEAHLSEQQVQYQQRQLQQQFDQLAQDFYALVTVPPTQPIRGTQHHELEVRFGTKGVRRLTRVDYDNVVQRLFNLDFQADKDDGKTFLRMYHEFLNPTHGQFERSNVRVELVGPSAIQEYCRTNQLLELYQQNRSHVRFLRKTAARTPDGQRRLPYVDVSDFNFRLCCQTERSVGESERNRLLADWGNVKKEFRYINRICFTHRDFPVSIELSIVQHGKRNKTTGDVYRDFTIDDTPSHWSVFDCPQTYEMEIEVLNQKVGPGTKYKTGADIAQMLRQVIKMVLSGLQRTPYPIGYHEQQRVIQSYMRLLWSEDSPDMLQRPINSKCFLGPNSVTLQIPHVTELDPDATGANIRRDFVVTDKADGERCLLYVHDSGKVFLLDINLNVLFTGAVLRDGASRWGGTLLDGEYIKFDKSKSSLLHRFAAFDVYYRQKKDVRAHPFYPLDQSLKPDSVPERRARYDLLKEAVAFLQQELRSVETVKPGLENTKVPIRVVCKQFWPQPWTALLSESQTTSDKTDSIFDACRTVLSHQDSLDYAVDGLIFTHKYFGVGSTVIGKAGPKLRISWEYSLKWKPPEFNSNDFLVTTVKDEQGKDVVHTIFDAGVDMSAVEQLTSYKTLELRCGFSPARDGVLQAMEKVLSGEFEVTTGQNGGDYFPQIFFPTEPFNPRAGFCHMKLVKDRSGAWQMMTEEGEVFHDQTVVEFRLDRSNAHMTSVEWQWKPIRVRLDKTSKMQRGEKEFGNSYRVCNENWKSMHFPVQRAWLEGYQPVPNFYISSDKYYNTPAGELQTRHMKCFHNLFVKRMLLRAVCTAQGTLIDLACGKAGDLMKWVGCQLAFVLGLDVSKDNLENQLDGACARYIKAKQRQHHITNMLFAEANSAWSVRQGQAGMTDVAKQVIAAVFGQEALPEQELSWKKEDLPKGVRKFFGIAQRGFQVCSCQFAMHYFFESPETLMGFLRNVNQCTALNGYFVGTAFDGKLVFQSLRQLKTGESVELHEQGKKIWQVVKGYGGDTFPDSAASIGFRIDVFQESINQLLTEYLINFDYFDRLMAAYGFRLLTPEESRQMGLPGKSSGLFSELYDALEQQVRHELSDASEFSLALQMTENEKKISFLNRYFVYKKINDVNADNVQLDLEPFLETAAAREVGQKEEEAVHMMEVQETVDPAPVRRLSKRVELVPDDEFVLVADEEVPPVKKSRKKADTRPNKTEAKANTEAKAAKTERKPRAKKAGEPEPSTI